MGEQEGKQCFECCLRILLRHEVTGVDAVALDAVAPFAPGLKRAFGLAGDPRIAPQGQCRAGDLAPRRAVRFIGRQVIGRPGAVIVAGRMDVLRCGVMHPVFGERRLAEGGKIPGLGPAGDGVVEKAHRVLLDQHFRQRVRLGKEEPMVGLHRQLHREIVPHRIGRHDVKNGEAVHRFRMVERHAVTRAGAPVMSHHGEALVPQHLHEAQKILRHGALGIGLVLRVVGRAG